MKDEEGLNFSRPGELSGPEQQTIEALSCLQGAAYRRVGPEWRVPGRLSQETNSGHKLLGSALGLGSQTNKVFISLREEVEIFKGFGGNTIKKLLKV